MIENPDESGNTLKPDPILDLRNQWQIDIREILKLLEVLKLFPCTISGIDIHVFIYIIYLYIY